MNVETVVARLRRRQLVGSYAVASETALLLRQVVSTFRWQHIDQLIDHVRDVGSRLVTAQPRECASGNIVRQVLKMIREEHAAAVSERRQEAESEAMADSMTSLESGLRATSILDQPVQSSILNLLGRPAHHPAAMRARAGSKAAKDKASMPGPIDLKPALIAGIQIIMDDLKKIYKDISEKALDYIHASEVILTHGASRTVLAFLKAAAEKRTFTVIVTESYPNDVSHAHKMAAELGKAGLRVILVPDTAVFGIMSGVSKVFLGTHAVLQNGGLLAAAGANLVARAAKAHATPVVVVTGLYKLTPHYPYDLEGMIEVVSPEAVLPYKFGKLVDTVEVVNPYYDYVAPELVDLYVTNLGGHPPTFLNRIMVENYDTEDYDLSSKRQEEVFV
ncbi:translation initiation factor eIF-2B subunit beta [Protomyces lactucae-debilis]|uniref:Translation initiation factor eIF2B subunit beta n=1 Tax=Protomyces lactucae-debilis TaxID=2754530 RepID=A0A1Y2FUJ8_PROLT|nr:translation initiation factor eIF-2B subunit beta [Protomyces lactucae-debilis]ORY87690.1 translation initiation factor eIF-2B subunit beta [Protomyces lactucae-debilis]